MCSVDLNSTSTGAVAGMINLIISQNNEIMKNQYRLMLISMGV